jgi:cell division septal protein FtsQ
MKHFSGQHQLFFSVIFIALIFAGFISAGWFLVRKQIVSRSEYRLTADRIQITVPPLWVPDNFVTEVLQNSGLDTSATLFDVSLPQKLSQAFSASPWVEEVRQVQIRYPSGAEVQLVYRVPMALVEMPSQGLYPVDRNGILLPTDYFISVAPKEKENYPRITGIRSAPLGVAGTLWGDPLVHAAAQLAGLLEDVSQKLGLVKIIPSHEATPTGHRIICRLQTNSKTEIIWGRFEPNDPKNIGKKKRLLEIDELYHSLDNVPAQFQPIDLSKD